MGKLYISIVFFLCLLSCKNDVKPSAPGNYLQEIVGTMKDGKINIVNHEAIKSAWEASPVGGITIEIDDFEIVNGVTEGDENKQYYLLLAKNEKGDIKTAASLILKNGNFYFEPLGEASIYLKITCKGLCDTGCMPVLKISEGNKYLVCSSCPECVKVESEMH